MADFDIVLLNLLDNEWINIMMDVFAIVYKLLNFKADCYLMPQYW